MGAHRCSSRASLNIFSLSVACVSAFKDCLKATSKALSFFVVVIAAVVPALPVLEVFVAAAEDDVEPVDASGAAPLL